MSGERNDGDQGSGRPPDVSDFIRQAAFGSPLYEAMVRFRDEHLRKPLGLSQSAADLEGEDHQIHIAAFDGNAVLGTVLLKPVSATLVKLRQMAVAPATRQSGLGSKLVRFAERIAADRGFGAIEMNARTDARGFYEKLGYCASSEEFLEITVPHVKMTKQIRS